MDNLPSASYAGCYTIIVKHHHKMPKSRQKPDTKSSHEKQEEVTVVDKAVVEASSEPRGQSDGSGEKALLKFTGKMSSRLFSRPD